VSEKGPNDDRALPTQAGLPDGTVTFVFTDVVGSTELWDQAPRQMREAMVAHDRLVESAVEANSGMLVRPRGEGDSRFAVFGRASEAVAAAAQVLDMLENATWSTPAPIQVRVGIHTGEADLRDGDYYGTSVNLCARIRGLAEPNQVLVSEATSRMLMRSDFEVKLCEVGAYELKGLSLPERVFRLELRSDDSVIESTDRVHRTTSETALRLVPTNNLPIQTTSFVARERELTEVTELLTESRLVTLVGTGGAGKTRLAIQAASDLLDGSGDGV
jgi:class 3 adenylate cyclase